MDELVDQVGELTSIAVRDEDDIVYVAHVAPQRVMTINVPLDGCDLLYCTALGRLRQRFKLGLIERLVAANPSPASSQP